MLLRAVTLGLCLVLTACQTFSSGALPTLVPTARLPVGTTEASSSPQPAAPIEPTKPPLPEATFAPRPTATAYAPPTSEPGLYVNAEYNLRLRYPDNWRTQSADNITGGLIWLTGPGERVFSLLFVNGLAPGESLQAAATAIWEGSFSEMEELRVLKDSPATLDDGRSAWTTLVTGLQDGDRLKVNLTTTADGARTFSLMTFGSPEMYDAYQDDIETLHGALEVGARTIYGLPRSQTLVLESGESTNPRDYDPATSQYGVDRTVFSGLVMFDDRMQVVPDLAAGWEIEDGTRYTFHLRPEARFHNGRPVTAQDVIDSWERAAKPETDSNTVLTYLGDIVGVRAMRAGEADHISGLRAIDDHTLEVTIDAPKPYFLLKLTHSVALVVDRENVASGPEWYRTPNGTGPYRLVRWEPFKMMLFERNDEYYLELPAIKYLVVQLYSGISSRLYELGEVDFASVGFYDLPRFLNPDEPMHAELHSTVGLCTGYIVFDTAQPPFDDVKVRQAFSMAFDRQAYVEIATQGFGLPAHGLYPPGLPGYNADLTPLPYDPERARQLLAESKYGGPAGLPPIVYTSSGWGSDVGSRVGALAQMWHQTLGVTLTVENLEPNRYLDEIDAGRHGQIFDGGWCADYPDPENFADALLHTGAEQNQGHYSNPELDALLEQARTEADVTRRIQLYQQAEQIIVDEAPLLFTLHSQIHMLVKPYIRGFVLTPLGVPMPQRLSIDESKINNP